MRILSLVLLLIGCIEANSQQLVLRGDHADPSVVKIGNKYWASATTSNWFPAYPLLSSNDLVNWKSEGYVFDKVPAWADFYFWAPEISYENGKVYIYYSAHKKDGNLCLGIASADKPEGPYTDHGPLMCQEVGSIDAFPMRDENGKLFIIWKEDGNSVNKPTPIWIQELNEERTAFLGEKKELFRNNKAWEGNLVEGVAIIRKDQYFYAFYAGAACCGRECTYKTGVARAKSLHGPWEKYDKNPIMVNDEKWKCPGHGTAIEKDGKYYFLYHAYDKSSDVFTGRQGLLAEFNFTADGWIEFAKTPPGPDVALTSFNDEFKGRRLSGNWQWSIFQDIEYKQKCGKLRLGPSAIPSGAYLGIKTTSGSYTATAVVNTKKSNQWAGIAAIGDDKNIISALYKDGIVKLVQLRDGKETEISSTSVSPKKTLNLELRVTKANDLMFYYYDGTTFKPLNEKTIDGSFLPPWDRALRVGIVAKGDSTGNATFNAFFLNNK